MSEKIEPLNLTPEQWDVLTDPDDHAGCVPAAEHSRVLEQLREAMEVVDLYAHDTDCPRHIDRRTRNEGRDRDGECGCPFAALLEGAKLASDPRTDIARAAKAFAALGLPGPSQSNFEEAVAARLARDDESTTIREQLREAQAQAGVMREALTEIQQLAKEPRQGGYYALLDIQQATETALSSDAGRTLLERVERAERRIEDGVTAAKMVLYLIEGWSVAEVATDDVAFERLRAFVAESARAALSPTATEEGA